MSTFTNTCLNEKFILGKINEQTMNYILLINNDYMKIYCPLLVHFI